MKHQENIAVLGAGGKMGSGIALLWLKEIANHGQSSLTLFDTNVSGFTGLKHYLKEQLVKHAEKQINQLRQRYMEDQSLVDNKEIIDFYVSQAFDRVRFVSSIKECCNATLVFEAIIEDIEAKSLLFKRASACMSKKTYFFSNTSSIPIHQLRKNSHIDNRLIGFHFYNPPAVQPLVELIIPSDTPEQLSLLSLEVAKRLNKTIVQAHDIAGFIGNGHFIREISFACELVTSLHEDKHPLTQAVAVVNKISQDWLLRPMGIFQLVDYVGIDICYHISKIMTEELSQPALVVPLVASMYQAGIRGGQHSDGSQKPGFFGYEKGKITTIYDHDTKSYFLHDQSAWKDFEQWVAFPSDHLSWKMLSKQKNPRSALVNYFTQLWQQHSSAALLAQQMLTNSRNIGQTLVDTGVANSINDVDIVLKTGFFHLYGVNEPFLHQLTNKLL